MGNNHSEQDHDYDNDKEFLGKRAFNDFSKGDGEKEDLMDISEIHNGPVSNLENGYNQSKGN